MQVPPLPRTEPQRLAALYRTQLLDTDAEPRFDRLTHLAQLCLNTEIVLVSLVDVNRQWFKSKQGLDACETSRDISFCGHAILGDALFIIPNALEDNRFADNPLVTGPPFIRFYAGMPLTRDGEKIGTLCFIDSKAQQWSSAEQAMALKFAALIEQEIEDRLQEQAHLQLQSSEQMYRSVLEGTRIGTWQWNVQTGETVFNDRWAEIVGYQLAELAPVSIKTWLALVHPDDLVESERLLTQHFAGQLPFYDCKCRMLHKHGHYVWVHDRGRVISWSADGQPLMMYGTHADITEAHSNQLALLSSRDQLLKLTQQLPGVVYQFQLWPDGRMAFPYASAAIERIYGVRPDDVVTDASCVLARIHPADLASVVQSIQHSASGQTIWQLEYRVVDDDGKCRWLSGRSVPEKMPDGSTLWHGYIHDVTETKEHYLQLEQLNQQLNIAQQRLELASEQAKIGYWQASLKQGSLWWSPIVYQIFGFDAEKVTPSVALFKSTVHPDDVALIEQSEQRALTSGVHNVVHRIIRPDGEIRWVHELAQLLPAAKNPDLMMIGSVQDITERMKLQQVKDEFISTVSHELRTPLTSIYGALSLLQSGKLGVFQDNAQQLLNVATSNCKQLTHLINDLLDIEKLAAGKMLLELKPVQLAQVLHRAVTDHQPYAMQRQIKLKLVLSPTLSQLTLSVDEHRLLQILANLLSNAVKFSPIGGEVTVSVAIQAKEAEIAVQDQGPGVPIDFQHRIFQRFSQADASSAKVKGGTGLGLALCKELVEAMHGSIGFESKNGEGARFYVRLPIL